MSYMEDSIDWQTVHYIDQFLDENVSQEYKDQPLAQDWARICKGIEELGESVDAFIGATEQNPRKGKNHSMVEVMDELADTALTAIYAMQHFTKNTAETRSLFRSRMKIHEERFRRLGAKL